MNRSALPFGSLLVVAMTAPALVAQGTEVALEVGASQVAPASGVGLDAARFAMGGIRASHYDATGSGLYASLLGGQVLGDTTGGNFLSALVEAQAVEQWTASTSGSVDIKILAFGIDEPFPYRTLATEVGSTIRHRTARTSLKLRALGSLGNSRIELWRTAGGPVRTFQGDHWRVGSTAEWLIGNESVQVGPALSAHRASGGSYNSVGARFVVGGDWGVVEIRGDRWSTPEGIEATGGIALAIPVGGGVDFRGFFGRSDPDPLTLAQPGGGSAGALVGWKVVSPDGPNVNAPYQLMEIRADGSRVRIAIEGPPGASRMALLGDFSLWQPLEMTREGDRWVIEVDIPVGAHHYGFLANDDWYLPDDSPNVVPDEWGRETATLVIEGAGS